MFNLPWRRCICKTAFTFFFFVCTIDLITGVAKVRIIQTNIAPGVIRTSCVVVRGDQNGLTREHHQHVQTNRYKCLPGTQKQCFSLTQPIFNPRFDPRGELPKAGHMRKPKNNVSLKCSAQEDDGPRSIHDWRHDRTSTRQQILVVGANNLRKKKTFNV